jgi:hypothetical protein
VTESARSRSCEPLPNDSLAIVVNGPELLFHELHQASRQLSAGLRDTRYKSEDESPQRRDRTEPLDVRFDIAHEFRDDCRDDIMYCGDVDTDGGRQQFP